MSGDELDRLIQDLLDGCIGPEKARALEQELLANPESMDRYLSYADLDGLLQVQSEVDGQMNATTILIREVVRRERRRMFHTSIFAAAAVLLITAIVLRMVLVPPVSGRMSCEFSPSSRFEVFRAEGNSTQAEGTLGDGDRLTLQQGCVELKIDTGVRAVVAAPANLIRKSSGKIVLEEGRAWFHVESKAAGFGVLTPHLEVVDLGTEFGVRASRDRADEVHVFKGKVRASSKAGRQVSEILQVGEARSVDPVGRLISINRQLGDFLDRLPDSLPHLHWSFDGMADGGFATSGTFPSVADIHAKFIHTSSGRSLVDGIMGKALRFDGVGDHVVADWSGFAGNRPRTVSVWVRLEPKPELYYKQYSGIVGWGNEADLSINAKWKILAVQENRGGPVALRLSWGFNWIDGTTNLADGRWHHLAVSTTGGSTHEGKPYAELYVDGVMEKTSYGSKDSSGKMAPLDTDTTSNSAASLIMGSDLNPVVKDRIYFRGSIDELTIFDGYLPQSEITRLSQP